MGKSRKNNGRNNKPYTTPEGVLIEDTSHSLDFYNELSKKIEDWVGYEYGRNPASYLSEEELEFILEQMTPSKNTLTRVEPIERNFEIEDEDEVFGYRYPEVGDTFNFDGELKAFSKSMTATKDFINHWMKDERILVIYRLPKGTPQFNVQQWDNEHPEEQESWCSGKNYTITNIGTTKIGKKIVRLVDLAPQ